MRESNKFQSVAGVPRESGDRWSPLGADMVGSKAMQQLCCYVMLCSSRSELITFHPSTTWWSAVWLLLSSKETNHGGWTSFSASQHCRSVCRGISILISVFLEFHFLSQVASVHGLRYIFEERLPSSDRILWTAAVLLGLLLSGTMVVQVCKECDI